jgi:hypothetical protein
MRSLSGSVSTATDPSAAKTRSLVLADVGKIRRVEKLPLQIAAGSMDRGHLADC